MKYIDENLNTNEEVIETVEVNFLAILPKVISFCAWAIGCFLAYILVPVTGELSIVLLCLIAVLLAKKIWNLLARYLELKNRVMCLTNKRLLGKTGVFSIDAIDIPIEKINSVSASSTFWGRLFNYSTICIHVDGIGFLGIREFEFAKNAIRFKNTLMEEIEKYKETAQKKQAEEIRKAMQGGATKQ